jgi:SAM-dependent methyltransferase
MTVTFRQLTDLPVRIDSQSIEASLHAFALPVDDARWNALLRRRRRKALRRGLARLIGRGRRHRSKVAEEYRSAWSAGYARYRLERDDLNPAPWIWRGRRLLLDPAGATRMRTILFAAVLEELKPRKVLEVGSGNGINLFSLAGAFPDVEFTGVELTEEGVGQAKRAQQDNATLESLRTYSPLPTHDPDALRRVEFVQGDASAMPFADGSFDVVLTVLALEQMERIRSAALREIARVSSTHALMLEPFRDVNSRGLRRLYVFGRNYFRGSIEGLAGYGLPPLWATDDFPQEAFLGAALVLGRTGATRAA